MEQALENVLDRLQKLYQLKSIQLEKIDSELEIRKTAVFLAHQKEVEQIVSFDRDRLAQFLKAVSADSNITLENFSIACTVIRMANHPAVKSGKRYLDALGMIEKVKSLAISYEELKRNLMEENAKVTKEIELMGELSNKIVQVQVIDIDKYLTLFTETVYPEKDIQDRLMAVATIVRKNADLLEKESQTGSELEELKEYDTQLNNYQEMINHHKSKYKKYQKEEVTNLYIKNVEELFNKEKMTQEEVKNIFFDQPDLYEYFLFDDICLFLQKAKGETSLADLLEDLEKIEILQNSYQEILNRKEVARALSKTNLNGQTLLYNAWIEENLPTFQYKKADQETVSLLNQLRVETKLSQNENITLLDKKVGIILGDTKFLLFQKLPKNHLFIIMEEYLDHMAQAITTETIAKLEKNYSPISEWVQQESDEYVSLLDASKKIEHYLQDKEERSWK